MKHSVLLQATPLYGNSLKKCWKNNGFRRLFLTDFIAINQILFDCNMKWCKNKRYSMIRSQMFKQLIACRVIVIVIPIYVKKPKTFQMP